MEPASFQKVHAMVRQFLPAEYDTENVAAQIIVHSWERSSHVSRGFVRLKCIDAVRARRREQSANEASTHEPISSTPSPERVTLLKSTIERVTSMCLTPFERRIVYYKYWTGLSTSEIALEVGSSPREVQKALQVAIYKMRIELT